MAGPLQAEVPREFGKSLRACVCCKLVKTFDQVRVWENHLVLLG
jgi:hypothetical protein